MISALMFSSGPPELPGLIAASVWTTFSSTAPFGSGTSRPSAETTPAVTVGPPSRPSALPIATTHSPTRSWLESPSRSVGSGSPRAVDLDHGQVGLRVAADQPGVVGAAVRQRDPDLLRALDDVVVGDDEAGRVDDRARADAALRLGAERALGRGRAHGDERDRRARPVGDLGDGRGGGRLLGRAGQAVDRQRRGPRRAAGQQRQRRRARRRPSCEPGATGHLPSWSDGRRRRNGPRPPPRRPDGPACRRPRGSRARRATPAAAAPRPARRAARARATRISSAWRWQSSTMRLIASSTARAVSSLYQRGRSKPPPRKLSCAGESSESRPTSSLMPQRVTIWRAIVGGLLQVVLGPGRDVAEDELLGRAAAERAGDAGPQVVLG